MARGHIINDRVEALIASVHREHPKWKAPEIRNEVDYILHKNNPNLSKGFPGLSAVQKVLATVRKRVEELSVDPQDKPWSMGALDKYPIPPDVLPIVLKLWKFIEDATYKTIQAGGSYMVDPSLTVRQAKWAGRLAHVIEDIGWLANLAQNYASFEQLFQYIDKPFDSHLLDIELMEPDRTCFGPPFSEPAALSNLLKGLMKEVNTRLEGTK